MHAHQTMIGRTPCRLPKSPMHLRHMKPGPKITYCQVQLTTIIRRVATSKVSVAHPPHKRCTLNHSHICISLTPHTAAAAIPMTYHNMRHAYIMHTPCHFAGLRHMRGLQYSGTCEAQQTTAAHLPFKVLEATVMDSANSIPMHPTLHQPTAFSST